MLDTEHVDITNLQFLSQVTAWGEAQPDIRAVLLIGSHARTDHPADPWSDVDLILTVRDVQPYLARTEWLETFGKVWVTHTESTSVHGVAQRRVLFAGSVDVDFVFVSENLLPQMMQHPDVAMSIRRGMRVLVDKDRMMSRITLPIGARIPYQPPTQAQFTNLVNDFWYQSVGTAKKLMRGELWMAKLGCDTTMKRLLLQMLEWHARSVGNQNYDTWFGGRFVEEWADVRALNDLRAAYAYYDSTDIRRALLASMNLFRWVATETAYQLDYPYAAESDQHVTAWVTAQLGIGG